MVHPQQYFLRPPKVAMEHQPKRLHRVEQNDGEVQPLARAAWVLAGSLVSHAVEDAEGHELEFLVQRGLRGRLRKRP